MKTQTLGVNHLSFARSFFEKKLGFVVEKEEKQQLYLSFEQQTLILKEGFLPGSVVFNTDHFFELEKRILSNRIRFEKPSYQREEETETFNKVFQECAIQDEEGHVITFSSMTHYRC